MEGQNTARSAFGQDFRARDSEHGQIWVLPLTATSEDARTHGRSAISKGAVIATEQHTTIIVTDARTDGGGKGRKEGTIRSDGDLPHPSQSPTSFSMTTVTS